MSALSQKMIKQNAQKAVAGKKVAAVPEEDDDEEDDEVRTYFILNLQLTAAQLVGGIILKI